jgi:hypothetical protein
MLGTRLRTSGKGWMSWRMTETYINKYVLWVTLMTSSPSVEAKGLKGVDPRACTGHFLTDNVNVPS